MPPLTMPPITRTPTGAPMGGHVGASVITPAQFNDAIEHGSVVVEFFNYGCAFCKAALPEVHKAANQLAGSAKVVMLPLGSPQAQALASAHGVNYLPSFAVFHDGAHQGTFGRTGHEKISAATIVAKAKNLIGG